MFTTAKEIMAVAENNMPKNEISSEWVEYLAALVTSVNNSKQEADAKEAIFQKSKLEYEKFQELLKKLEEELNQSDEISK